MEYPNGHWEYCGCGSSYFLYDDGTGSCSRCSEARRKFADAEEKRKKAKVALIKKLRKENARLKERLSHTPNEGEIESAIKEFNEEFESPIMPPRYYQPLAEAIKMKLK